MAEEKDAHDLAESVLSRDDMSALAYVLQHVKGSSPSSVTRLGLEMSELDDAAQAVLFEVDNRWPLLYTGRYGTDYFSGGEATF